MKTQIWTLILLAAIGCSSKKSGEPAAGTASGSAAPTPVAPAGSGSAAPAGSGSGSATAGSGSSAAGSGSDAGPSPQFLAPDEWAISDGHLEVVVGVNGSKYPVDNAVFRFDYGIDHVDMPKDPKEYAKVLESSKVMEKITKTEAVTNGTYYENAESFRYVITAGDARIFCGGSLYKGGDFDKIPKERDEVVAKAKKICASAKL